jgi:predicted Zn-dependent protease
LRNFTIYQREVAMKNSYLNQFLVFSVLVVASFTACEQLGGMVGKKPPAGVPVSSSGMTAALTPQIPPAAVYEFGNYFYRREIQTQKEKGNIEERPEFVKPIERIFDRLKRTALEDPDYAEVAKELDWQLNTIKDKSITMPKAFPGGGIAIYEGLFPHAKTEGAFAGILGHEMAHVLLRHEIKRLSALVAAEGAAGGAIVASLANPKTMDPKVVGPVAGSLGLGYYFGQKTVWAQEQEKDADCTGLLLAAKAGYEPAKIVSFWEGVNKDRETLNKSLDFLKEHPMNDARYKYIKDTCQQKAEDVYKTVGKEKQQDAAALLPREGAA